ncbi:MAG: hypothetical protein GY954_02465, partial [Alteromonas sp.]|nr:hypothetical protein [Alteromonas sp.]
CDPLYPKQVRYQAAPLTDCRTDLEALASVPLRGANITDIPPPRQTLF